MKLKSLRHTLINWLSFGEPVLLNFLIFGGNVKDNKYAVYVHGGGEKITVEEAEKLAVLVAKESVI